MAADVVNIGSRQARLRGMVGGAVLLAGLAGAAVLIASDASRALRAVLWPVFTFAALALLQAKRRL